MGEWRGNAHVSSGAALACAFRIGALPARFSPERPAPAAIELGGPLVDGVRISNRLYNGTTPLDTLPDADQKIFDTYNKPPYVDSAGGIPFANIGGKYVTSGASFSPELLEGKSRAEIAAALSDPSSDIAKAVVANANVLTAAICEATGNKPAVCTSAGVQAGAAALAKGQK